MIPAPKNTDQPSGTPSPDGASPHAAGSNGAGSPGGNQPGGGPGTPGESSTLEQLLSRNLRTVQARILDAASEVAASGGGEPAHPALVAVTKTVPAPIALALRQLLPDPGHLAENRADVFQGKVAAFAEAQRPAKWHFIGHIQRNKARRIVEHADVIHSVDSLRLASTLVRLCEELERPEERPLEVFLEVNLTGESEKHGLSAEETPGVLDALGESRRIQVAGLMAMGPARGLRNVDQVFAEVADLGTSLQNSGPERFMDGTCRLSMGMSNDLEAAIRHGSDLVRVGSALFQGLDSLPEPNAPAPDPANSQGPPPGLAQDPLR